MKLYLTGIKSYQLNLSINYTAFGDPRLERTIQRIKRDYNESERQLRSPLTRLFLLYILRHLCGSQYDQIVLQAAFTLAFAAFLGVGEFTYHKTDKQLDHSGSRWFLTKQSIKVSRNVSQTVTKQGRLPHD